MIAVLLVLCLAYPLMRLYARRVDARDLEPAEKWHRLNRAVFRYFGIVAVFAVLAGVELGYETDRLGVSDDTGVYVVLGVFLAATVGGLLLAYLAILPYAFRLRGMRQTTGQAARPFLPALLGLLAQGAVWGMLTAAGVAVALVHPAGVIVLYALQVLFVVGMAVTEAPRVQVMLPVRQPDPGLQDRFARLCADHGVQVSGVRVVTSPDKSANSAFAGLWPGPRYVYVTDDLLDNFSDDVTDAAMAFGLGAAKQHWSLVNTVMRLGAVTLAVGGSVGWLSALRLLPPDARIADVPIVPVLLPGLRVLLVLVWLLIVLSLFLLVRWYVFMALERRADDFASAAVGADPVRRLLEKVAAANLLRRRTGRTWGFVTQRSSVQSRLDRLRTGPNGDDETSPPDAAAAGSTRPR